MVIFRFEPKMSEYSNPGNTCAGFDQPFKVVGIKRMKKNKCKKKSALYEDVKNPCKCSLIFK